MSKWLDLPPDPYDRMDDTFETDYIEAELRDALRKKRERSDRQREIALVDGRAKLTPSLVRKIRADAAAGATQNAVADKYGLSQGTVGRVIRRTLWANLD